MSRWAVRMQETFEQWRGESPTFTNTWFSARLESAVEGAYFQAEVCLLWEPDGHPSPESKALAEEHLRAAMRDVARLHSVLHHGEAASAIVLALADTCRRADLDPRPVQAQADVKAEPAGVELAEETERLRRETTLKNAERLQKIKRLRFLGDHILGDPGMAKLWWLGEDLDRLPGLAQEGPAIERATAELNGTSVKAAQPDDPIPVLLREFFDGLRPEHRALLLKQLRSVFHGFEREDLAEQVDLLLEPDDPGVNGQAPSPWFGRGAG